MSSKKTIFVCVPPGSGHVNPISSMIYELCQNKHIKVIFYGNKGYQETIEKTGAEFRLYCHLTFESFDHDKDSNRQTFLLVNKSIDFSYEIIPQLLADVEKDKPDLIIYDQFFLPLKYLEKILEKRMKNPPKTAMFLPSFGLNYEILESVPGFIDKSLWGNVLFLMLFIRQLIFNWFYSIWFSHPFQVFAGTNKNLNIVAVFPELQPKREMFDRTFNFVGPCIAERVRNYEVKDEELRKILDEFEPIERADRVEIKKEGKKLVYVSVGTVFNQSNAFFEKIIEAFRDRKTESRVVVSVGEKILGLFNDKMKNEGYKLPENVSLFAKVPQIEVLKRASVFITHNGMNSTSEAIEFGVPMICVPISADQPIVARRVCDELGLGIRLHTDTLETRHVTEALDEIFSNPKYAKNVANMSKISSSYNGTRSAAKLILDYLQSSEKKSN